MKVFKTLLTESSIDEKMQMLYELQMHITSNNTNTEGKSGVCLSVAKDKKFRVTYEDYDTYSSPLKISTKIYDETCVSSFKNIKEFLISVMKNDVVGNTDDVINLCIGGSVAILSATHTKPFHTDKALIVLKNSSKYGHTFLFNIEAILD